MVPCEAICWDHATGILLAQAAAIIASYGACSGSPSCPLATLREAGASSSLIHRVSLPIFVPCSRCPMKRSMWSVILVCC